MNNIPNINIMKTPLPWDYHPDPTIDESVRAEVLESEITDLTIGYPARWWICPQCQHFHNRGFFLAYGQHRCLYCGYVGDHGRMEINKPRGPQGAPDAYDGVVERPGDA